jgi:hypothetical protein
MDEVLDTTAPSVVPLIDRDRHVGCIPKSAPKLIQARQSNASVSMCIRAPVHLAK